MVGKKGKVAAKLNTLTSIRNNEVMEIKGDRIIVGPDYGIRPASFSSF